MGKSRSIPLPSKLLVYGKLSSDPATIAKDCACHFFPIEPPSNSYHPELEASVVRSLSLPVYVHPPVISDWELEAALRSLNPKAAAGSDGISAEILILSLPEIKFYLSAILNACLQLRIFPSTWKRSKVVVIGKPKSWTIPA
jgi:hypothetical protein